MFQLAFLIILFLFSSQGMGVSSHVVLPLKAIPHRLSPESLIQVDQYRIIGLLADSLFEYGKNLQIAEKLAESSTWNNERTTLQIKLRGGTFADGSPITSNEVVKSLENCVRFSKKDTTSALGLIEGYEGFVSGKEKSLAGLKTIDERTFSIRTVEFAPLIKENLASVSCSIVKEVSGSTDLLQRGLGTGPYVLATKEKDHIILKKRYGHGPNEVKFQSTDKFGDFNALKDQMSLILVDHDPGPTPEFRRYPNSRLGNWQFSFNNLRPPFDRVDIRRAISLSVDFQVLREGFGWEMERMQSGLFPFGMRGFKHREKLVPNNFEAEKILRENGFSEINPLQFTITLSKRYGIGASSNIWQSAFKSRLLKPMPVVLDHRSLVKRRDGGEFDVLFHGKSAGSHDPHIILASYLSKSRFNTSRIRNAKCDQLIKSALQTYERNTRWAKYFEAEKCLLDTHFVIPLATVSSGFALVRKPWKLARRNMYRLYPYFVHEWFIPEGGA